MLEDFRNNIIEHAPVYLSKAFAAIGLLGIATIEEIDFGLRAILGILAAAVSIWTIKRMRSDIAYKNQQTKEKIVEIKMKEEQLKQYIIENEIRAKELQKLIESTKQNKDGEIS